jgi:hypothetical protein
MTNGVKIIDLYMKKITGIILLCILISACGSKNSELIIGKWKIDDIVTPVDWSKVPEDRKQQIQQDIQDHVAIQKSFGYYEFFPEGKAVSFDGKVEFDFRWRLNEDEDLIYFKPPEGVEEDVFTIAELEEKKLVLTRKDPDGEMRITLVK